MILSTNVCLENAKDVVCRIAVPRHDICTGGVPAKSSDGSHGGSVFRLDRAVRWVRITVRYIERLSARVAAKRDTAWGELLSPQIRA